MMNKSATIKRDRCRTKKVVIKTADKARVVQNIGIPAFIEPTVHDMNDELSRLDSFAYSKYNN